MSLSVSLPSKVKTIKKEKFKEGDKMLVGETTGGGFETPGGDKTHCFISRNK